MEMFYHGKGEYLMNLNVLLEFSAKNNGTQGQKAINMIEKNCQTNDLFLVGWQRDGQKIRILSKYTDIMKTIDTKHWNTYQCNVIVYRRIKI